MEVLVIGEGCRDCDKLYQNTEEAIKALGLDCELRKVESLKEIVKLGVYTAPSLMVDGELLVSGRVAKTREIEKLLKKL